MPTDLSRHLPRLRHRVPLPDHSTADLARVRAAVSALGPVSGAAVSWRLREFAGVHTAGGSAGQVARVLPGLRTQHHHPVYLSGTGRSTDGDEAVNLAVVETLERYSSAAYSNDDFIVASASEVGDGPGGFPFADVARCSPTELADPTCTLAAADEDLPQRWVWGTDLHTGAAVLVPAVMAFLYLMPRMPGERYWQQISTGVAAHGSATAAVLAGLCEVVERDAISVVWAQRLPLPLLPDHVLGDKGRAIVAELGRRFVRVVLLDATTDVGLATVYCVLLAPHADRAAQVVACATGPTLAAAAEKSLGEAFTVRGPILREQLPDTDLLLTTTSVTTGAAFMGLARRRSAFDFLADPPVRGIAPPALRLPAAPRAALDVLLGRLADLGMNAYAVDLTCDEAVRVGISVVRVVVPQLHPMTLMPRARCRDHARLYDLPARLGYPVRAEADLNPWPQPFA